MISFGPFQLTEMIGEGGMGQIWQARHDKQAVDVAIKVIHADRVSSPDQIRLFEREALAMAMLNHPTIVGVYDYGFISEDVERASRKKLVAKSPYLVMDFAPRGSLADCPRPTSWDELKRVLLHVLEGLAHAHAHDLIHRDLKPGNVLIAERDGRKEHQLTDFGIAYVGVPDAFSADMEERVRMAGTPGYMAPEQIRGHWRGVGPWTDLYALGCMAYERACGRLPFEAPTATAMLLSHLSKEPAPLRPTLAVPPGFDAWIARLLEKSATRRFRHAADAAWALSNLDHDWKERDDLIVKAPIAVDSLEVGSLTQLYADPTLLWTDLASAPTALQHRTDELDDECVPSPPSGPLPPAPMPSNWEVPEWPALIPLSGVGLGLFGKRRVGFVGRIEERDLLWNTLAEVRQAGKPRAVVIDGPAGSGKSALAEWIGRRAAEVGAATFLKASFNADGQSQSGPGATLSRFFNAGGLDEGELRSHLHQWIQIHDAEEEFPFDPEALTRLMRAPESSDRDYYLSLIPLLRYLGRRRPVVFCLDDAHWSAAILEFVSQALRLGIPILFILTIRDEALAKEPAARQIVDVLQKHSSCNFIHLNALSQLEQQQLIRQLLPLAEELIGTLGQRSMGNPLFAVELLRDWVDRGVLTLRHGRFRVAPGTATDLPDSLHQVWADRIDHIVRQYPDHSDDVRHSIELGACLGRTLRIDEVRAAIGFAGLDVPERIIDHFATERLTRGDRKSATFIHEILRESILRMAEEAGRLTDYHQICIQVLDHLYGDGDLQVKERRCRHLVGAGREAEALDTLIVLADEFRNRIDYPAALGCATAAQDILHQLGAPESDLRQLLLWGILGWCQRTDVELAADYARRIEKHARLPEHAEALGQSHRLQAKIARRQGDLDGAEDHYKRAQELLESAGDTRGLAQATLGLGVIHRMKCNYDTAKELLTSARATFEKSGDDRSRWLSICLMNLGRIEMATGDFLEAQTLLLEALHLAESGADDDLLPVRVDLAEVMRHLGDIEGAQKHYLEIYAFTQNRGIPQTHISELNLAITYVIQRRFEDAWRMCKRAIAGMKRQGHTVYIGGVYLLAACCAAGTESHEDWQKYWTLATRSHQERPIIDHDIAWAAEEAGHLALLATWSEEALAAFRLALSLWEGRGDREAQERVQKLLRTAQSTISGSSIQ